MMVERAEARWLARVQTTLGEGPVWDPAASVLWFVDIEDRRIFRLDPRTMETNSWVAPAKVSWVFPAVGERLLAGLADGLYSFTLIDGRFQRLHEVEGDLPSNRLNDGTVGPDGEVWFGTMDQDERRPSGRFYRFDGRRVHPTGLAPACITNGPAVSPDSQRLYTVDTFARRIDVHTLSSDHRPADTRVFAMINERDGYPDGVTCDAEGGLWLGLWGGWSARRYDRDGRITHEVRLPVANVTKIALGGADGRTAFVTTARRGLDMDARTEQPRAGDLFVFDAPFAGAPIPQVSLPTI